MKTIWVVQYNDGTADVFDSWQGAPAWPYLDAFEVKKRITELEGALEAIEKYARIERLDEVTDIISGVLNKEDNKI